MPAAPAYQQLAFNGRVTSVMRLADNTSFLVPADGEDDDRYRENEDYLRYLADVEDGAVVAEPDPEPDPEPTPSERFDGVIDRARAELRSATTLAQVKAVFAGTLDGLKSIYGTGDR